MRLVNERLKSEGRTERVSLDDWVLYNPFKVFPKDIAEMIYDTFTEDLYNGCDITIEHNVINCIIECNRLGHKVEINTLCVDPKVIEYKRKFLATLGLGEIPLLMSLNAKEISCDIVIEDCKGNLKAAQAKSKILIRRPWIGEIDTEEDCIKDCIDVCDTTDGLHAKLMRHIDELGGITE